MRLCNNKRRLTPGFTTSSEQFCRGLEIFGNIVQDPGPNPQVAAAVRKEVLTPPPPPRPNPTPPHRKRGNRVRGGGGGRGSKLNNSCGDHFLFQDDDFTKG